MNTPSCNIEEARARRILMRRLTGARGSVFLEFALVAPLAVAVVCFTMDFAYLMRLRQQLEICSRFAADVESVCASAYCGSQKGTVITASSVRATLRSYLHYAAKHELTQHPLSSTNEIFIRYRQEGMLMTPVGTFLTGEGTALLEAKDLGGVGEAIMKIFSKALSTILDIVSFRTVRYLTYPIAADYMVGACVSAKAQTLIPASVYDFLGAGGVGLDKTKGFVVLPERHTEEKIYRYFCYMPNRDPVGKRPDTYISYVGNFVDALRSKLGIKEGRTKLKGEPDKEEGKEKKESKK